MNNVESDGNAHSMLIVTLEPCRPTSCTELGEEPGRDDLRGL